MPGQIKHGTGKLLNSGKCGVWKGIQEWRKKSKFLWDKTFQFPWSTVLRKNYRMLAQESKFSVLTAFRSNWMYLTVFLSQGVTCWIMVKIQIMQSCCYSISPTASWRVSELHFPNSLRSRTLSVMLVFSSAARFVHFCTWLNKPPILHGIFASWKATRGDWHSRGKPQLWLAGSLKPSQLYKSLV